MPNAHSTYWKGMNHHADEASSMMHPYGSSTHLGSMHRFSLPTHTVLMHSRNALPTLRIAPVSCPSVKPYQPCVRALRSMCFALPPLIIHKMPRDEKRGLEKYPLPPPTPLAVWTAYHALQSVHAFFPLPPRPTPPSHLSRPPGR